MKISVITMAMPTKMLKQKTSKRNAKFAQNVIISDTLNPVLSDLISKHKVSLGRYMDRRNGMLQFVPTENSSGDARMIVFKKTSYLCYEDSTKSYQYREPVMKIVFGSNSGLFKSGFVEMVKRIVKSNVKY